MVSGACGPDTLRETTLRIMKPHGDWLLTAPPCACTVEELVRALAVDGDCDGATLERVRAALSGRVIEAAAVPAAAPGPAFDSFGDGDDPFGVVPAVAAAVPRKPAALRKKPAARRPPVASSVQAPAPAPPRRRAAPAPAPAPADVRDEFTKKARALLKKMTRIIEDSDDLAGYDGLGFDDPGFRAAKRVRDALDAKRLADALDALELSVGKRGEHPPPSPSRFAGGASSSAASRTAPPSGNPAPRRRPKTRSTETAGDDVDMEGL